MKQPIRIGRINYTNVWPIFYHFPEERFHGEVEFLSQVPATLNAAMRAGTIDMGPISSFAYGENFREYVLFPDLSVSAWGRVNSLLLFHRKPLEEIKNGTFGLVNTSASSVNLTKIILEKFYGGKPSYFSSPPQLEEMMAKADAALLIGDDAIRASWANREYIVTDIGEEWNKFTNEWLTTAVWAVRKKLVEAQPELVAEVFRAFQESKNKGRRDPSGMIGQAIRMIGGTEEYWSHYFSHLTYDFGDIQWQGLQRYYDYAYELGLLPERASIQIWTEKTVTQVKE